MKKTFLYITGILFLSSFMLSPQKKIKVWLIGDSTMSQKEVSAFPETGWGMPFAGFFDSSVAIENRAKNGRSTKSFMSEGLWTPVVKDLAEGDFVFIQFGHNDEGKEKVGRYTTPDEFGINLKQYVLDAKSKKAIPILLTPVSRRYFDSTGKIRETHPIYTEVVKKVAKENNVAFIDLNERSRELYQQMGTESSKHLFLHLSAGEHPNHPEGKKDDTHFNELGARKIAQIVLQEIIKLDLQLARHIIKPPVKK
jgi:lysophospholipase L1-like esterase